MNLPKYEIMHSDCIPAMHELAKQKKQFDLSIFSPPFASLYTYSESLSDASNSKSLSDFWLWNRFFIASLEKVIADGRMVCIHIQDLALTKSQNGRQGVYDLSGDYIRMFEEFDFTFWCPITIMKVASEVVANSASAIPVLQFGTIKKDSLKTRVALVDRILVFKKGGVSDKPVTPVENGDMDFHTWCEWANGVWLNVDAKDVTRTRNKIGSNVRAYTMGKHTNDVKHMTPTQKEVYRRLMLMYSNPGEKILDPFAGTGTCFDVGIENNRKVTGIELKESYANVSKLIASRKTDEVNYLKRQPTLF